MVDVLSYGSSTPTEGSPTAVLSATTAALRNGGGCTDTNANSADFSVGTPAPRNSTIGRYWTYDDLRSSMRSEMTDLK